MRKKVQVWIFSEQRDCLLLKTNKARGAFWQPVTGSVEKDEKFHKAALREAVEETGFEFPQKPLDVHHEFQFQSRFGPALEKTYVLQIKEQTAPRLDPKEHQDFEWLDPDKALPRLKYPSNVEGLKRSYRILFGREL